MTLRLTLIGCGEAGLSFLRSARWGGAARAFDLKTCDPATAAAKRADYASAGISGCDTAAEALAGAEIVLSLVTADRALDAARDAAPHLAPGALWCDLNSVAPQTKRAAATVVEAAGARYADVAVMAPVLPGGVAVPLLVSGSAAPAALTALGTLGFTNLASIDGGIGAAATVKMLRSVVVKGVEALTAECLIAAARAGLVDQVVAALGPDYAARPDYNLDRMLVHGTRRAAEMGEVVATLEGLGSPATLSRATQQWQALLGRHATAPASLAAKLALVAA